MEALKSYLLTAMLATLAISLLLRLTDPRWRTYLRYIAGLCLLLWMSTPLLSLAGDLSDRLSAIDPPAISESDPASAPFLEEMGKTMSRKVGDLVAERFPIPRHALSVKLTLDLADPSSILIYRVEVTVYEDADCQAIEAYLADELGCPVQVVRGDPSGRKEKT